MNIHFFLHVPYEGPDQISQWCKKHGHTYTTTRFYEDSSLPDINTFDWLIIMGGPMSIHDDHLYPWLTEEKTFIKEVIKKNKIVLGICLGSQLIANALGAKVYRNDEKEIGWFPVTNTREAKELWDFIPTSFTPFHWHGDTFELPKGAIQLSHSEATKNQAFIYNKKVLGLQYHIELSREGIREIGENSLDDITDGPFIQSFDDFSGNIRHFENNHRILDGILQYLLLQTT